MMLPDYDFYQNEYLGNEISEEAFPRLSERAASFLLYYTQGRAEAASDTRPVKMALCAVAEQYQIMDAAQARATSAEPEVQSETKGKWSVSYRGSEETIRQARNGMKSAADLYLADTGLLYRGGRRCECGYHTL